ncbi:hypothetical protein BDV3_007192 [Batrachochytrium dendrobatidis]
MQPTYEEVFRSRPKVGTDRISTSMLFGDVTTAPVAARTNLVEGGHSASNATTKMSTVHTNRRLDGNGRLIEYSHDTGRSNSSGPYDNYYDRNSSMSQFDEHQSRYHQQGLFSKHPNTTDIHDERMSGHHVWDPRLRYVDHNGYADYLDIGHSDGSIKDQGYSLNHLNGRTRHYDDTVHSSILEHNPRYIPTEPTSAYSISNPSNQTHQDSTYRHTKHHNQSKSRDPQHYPAGPIMGRSLAYNAPETSLNDVRRQAWTTGHDSTQPLDGHSRQQTIVQDVKTFKKQAVSVPLNMLPISQPQYQDGDEQNYWDASLKHGHSHETWTNPKSRDLIDSRRADMDHSHLISSHGINSPATIPTKFLSSVEPTHPIQGPHDPLQKQVLDVTGDLSEMLHSSSEMFELHQAETRLLEEYKLNVSSISNISSKVEKLQRQMKDIRQCIHTIMQAEEERYLPQIIQLQAWTRGWIVRNRLRQQGIELDCWHRNKPESDISDAYLAELNAKIQPATTAVVKIQSLWRGYKERLRLGPSFRLQLIQTTQQKRLHSLCQEVQMLRLQDTQRSQEMLQLKQMLDMALKQIEALQTTQPTPIVIPQDIPEHTDDKTHSINLVDPTVSN